MRSIYKYIFICSVFALGACKKSFLDQRDPNMVQVNGYFNNEGDVLAAINGCYLGLRGNHTLGEESGLYTDERSDDLMRLTIGANNGEPFQFSNFALSPSNSYVKNHWTALYRIISRCNVVLSNIDKVSFSDPKLKDQYSAETKFIRALLYFELVRKWGAVPLATTQINSAAEAVQYTARTDEKIVYDQIVADLTDASNSSLPNTQFDYQLGRVSKAAAMAVLGKVYLTMATTIDEANRQANLANAQKYLTSAYDLRKFGELKSIPYTDVFDQTKQANCQELIFQQVNLQGDVNYSSSIAFSFQVKGETINSLKPATASVYTVKQDLINEYETGDPRASFSVKFAADKTVQAYFVTKFRDASAGATINGFGGNDWIVMRHADVILMLAEVNYYLGDNVNAIKYLDMVRERAGMPTYANSLKNAAYRDKYTDLKMAILHERRSEFAFEHQRWFDLLRFFKNEELVIFFRAKAQANYGSSTLANFSAKDRYFPIPFEENQLDREKMYQNPGY